MGEKWFLFYDESYDCIICDDVEFEEFWIKILEFFVDNELVQELGEYFGFYVVNVF